MNTSKLTIGLIFVLLVLGGCGKAPIGQALESLEEAEALVGQVTTLHYDVFSEQPIFFINDKEDITISWSQNGNVVFTPSITQGIVHSTGYYSTKNGWKEFTFVNSEGKVKPNDFSGNWVATPASSTITEHNAVLNEETIVLAYVCVYNDPALISVGTGSLTQQQPSIAGWKCGCLDDQGNSCDHYMAQSFKHVNAATSIGTAGTGSGIVGPASG